MIYYEYLRQGIIPLFTQMVDLQLLCIRVFLDETFANDYAPD
ncbi:hypothetical protein CAL7102_05814 [Dulcicalothrix desertica PCC 7102]|nr:hypothetical protein CAL7102_05814 [Dulcicalothrix desertica PCC 7102]